MAVNSEMERMRALFAGDPRANFGTWRPENGPPVEEENLVQNPNAYNSNKTSNAYKDFIQEAPLRTEQYSPNTGYQDAIRRRLGSISGLSTGPTQNALLAAQQAQLASMQSASGTGQNSSGGAGGYVAGFSNAKMTSQYGMRNGRMHTGTDFALPMGTPLGSMADGVVVRAGDRGGKGNSVTIRYSDGTESTFSHLDSINVKVGQRVGKGQSVGKSGNTGNSSGPHLHLEIRNSAGQLVNPATWLKQNS